MPAYIQRAYTEVITLYSHEFRANGDAGTSGFSFDCDSDGIPELKSEAAKENYAKCIDGSYDVDDMGIRDYKRTYRHRAVIKCRCCKGGEVSLANFTNTCGDCGADYNMSGQRLAPRSQWGEETGEHPNDCI